ncbi:hypothetical protein HPB48_020226 [Haemaphysalis longicornis]|uniref:Uncharacterized protein n=1 Tax=Haemaphysalis longicornis TaxID=44386 RepID=A0A9J6FCZ1_HAELO|nr:hypothetical protein HPB48_020226 [Haemaphysalis longicornis]
MEQSSQATARAWQVKVKLGAMLFAVETAVRLRDARTSTERSNMWLPAFYPRAQFKRLREIDFSSSKRKKKEMDQMQPRPMAKIAVKVCHKPYCLFLMLIQKRN